jgi:muramoyltetrapeptide carboxypeptidase
MHATIRPPAVQQGSTVGIVATSSAVTGDELNRLTGYFHDRGYQVRTWPSATMATGYLAGPAEQRAADLMAAFADPDVSLIVPATGGKGAAQLLPLLDYDTIAAHPTVFTGMSDPSIIGNALLARAGLTSLHGPSGYDFFQRPVNTDTDTAFWHAVSGELQGTEVKGDQWRNVRGTGRVNGPVVGGHLGTVRALIGTPYLPPLEGAVLILEEVFVPWVAVDQALTHLRLAGAFNHISALLVGVPIDCDRADAPDATWDDMIVRCVGGDCPIITNVEFGHTARKIPLPLGGRISIDLDAAAPVLRYHDNLVTAS